MSASPLRAASGTAAPRPRMSHRRCRAPAAWLDPRRAGETTQRAPPPPTTTPPPPPKKQQQQQELMEQTARHLLELNQRRAELAEQNAVLMREKAELAAALARAEADLARAATELSRAQQTAAAAAAAEAAAAAPAPPPAQAAPSPPPPPPPPPPAKPAFAIEYHSGWPRAFVHYRPSGGGAWTQAPGVAMRRQPRADDGARHVFALELGEEEVGDGADSLEFALTDGGGEWDNGGGSNYRAEGRGFAWRVRSGRLERI